MKTYHHHTLVFIDNSSTDLWVEYTAEQPYSATQTEPGYAGEVECVSVTLGGISIPPSPLRDRIFEMVDFDDLIDNAFVK